MSGLVLIFGGGTFPDSLSGLFSEYGLDLKHFDSRRGSNLRKQAIPLNTVGVMITIDRSHMTFGGSNELFRNLREKGIPVIFSNSNFASLSSGRLLINQLLKSGTLVKQEKVSKRDYQLSTSRQDWGVQQYDWNRAFSDWQSTESRYEEVFKIWTAQVDNWKLGLLEWKEINQKYSKKELRSKLGFFYDNILHFKNAIQSNGLELENEWRKLAFWYEYEANFAVDYWETFDFIRDYYLSTSEIKDQKGMKSLREIEQIRAEFKEGITDWLENCRLLVSELDWFLEEINSWYEKVEVWLNDFEQFCLNQLSL